MSRVVEILRGARDLIADPERWCQGAAARDESGNDVRVMNARACRFCAIGALSKQPPGAERGDARDHLSEAGRVLGFGGAADLNDHADHATVLRMYDIAIARAEASS